MQNDNTIKLLLTLVIVIIAAYCDIVTFVDDPIAPVAGAAFFSGFCLVFAILQMRSTSANKKWELLILILSACVSFVILVNAISRLRS